MLYTFKEWGSDQRDTYAAKLTDALNRLAQFPELDEMREDLAAGIRAWRVEQHIVFYRTTTKTLKVIRIRHVRANALEPQDL